MSAREAVELGTIDAHTAGEPLRIVVSGYPEPEGRTQLEKRAHAREHLDHLRRVLVHEPRGHADMYACVITRPTTDDGDLGVLFLHNEGYSTMCGHGIIALVTVGLEEGLFEAREGLVRIDTPAGRVVARPRLSGGRVEAVAFENVPSFVVAEGLEVALPGSGTVRFDLAYGGAFYAYVEAAALGLELVPESFRRIVELGSALASAVRGACTLRHPEGHEDLGFLYGVVFTGPARGEARERNVCVFADAEVDRSPTGTGVSGRAALLHGRGELAVGEATRIESLIGTCFDVRVLARTTVGGLPAVVPEVTGSAHVTGRHRFVVDPRDPLGEGFLLR